MWRSGVLHFIINESRRDGARQIWQGSLFCLFGLGIILFPQILVALVAMIFWLIGGFLLVLGWQGRQVRPLSRRHQAAHVEVF